ncbi:MAG: DegV family protein [Kineosporiaceae bacterium]|nr:DegV family protein [Kineosporiaceae bacterium]
MARVVVVTDSTSYLPEGLAAARDLIVVPLQVVLGGRSLAEGVEVDSAQVAAELIAGRSVTTSRPSPALFAQTYRDAARAIGGDVRIVSVHLSADLSGTVDAARTAAREVAGEGLEVLVVDSRNLALGLGFAALAAVRAAAAGEPAERVAELAARCAYGTGTWLYVDTLEHLRRGGRIGAAAAVVGSALSVKPLLQVVDGRIEPLERVRTTSRALARLEEIVVGAVGARRVDLGVQHLGAADRAAELADRLRARLPGLGTLYLGEVGAVIGAHAGPGLVGVVAAPAALATHPTPATHPRPGHPPPVIM